MLEFGLNVLGLHWLVVHTYCIEEIGNSCDMGFSAIFTFTFIFVNGLNLCSLLIAIFVGHFPFNLLHLTCTF